MSQMLSVIMIIVMAFSSLSGITSGIEDTVSFDAKIDLDIQAVMTLSGSTADEVPEETLQSAKAAGDIINALTVKGVATPNTAELDLIAGEEDVALSFGVKTDESGALAACSLLSGDVIFISADILKSLQQQMVQGMTTGNSSIDLAALQQLQGLDKEQIEKDAAEIGEKLAQAIEAKKGETESGEFTVDGLAFSEKTRVEMTYAEFVELLLTSMKELASKDSLKPLLQLTGTDFETEIDKAIEQVKNQPETDYPEQFDLLIYTNADSAAYYVCDMASKAKAEGMDPEQMHMAYGIADSLNRTKFFRVGDENRMEITATGSQSGSFDMHATAVDSSADLEINAKMSEAGSLDMIFTVKNEETNANIVVRAEPTENERTEFAAELYVEDTEKPVLAVRGSAGKGGEALSVYEGETINVIPIETLMDSENQTAAVQMQTKLAAGVMRVLTVIVKNVPEDTGAWIAAQFQKAISPNTTAAPVE